MAPYHTHSAHYAVTGSYTAPVRHTHQGGAVPHLHSPSPAALVGGERTGVQYPYAFVPWSGPAGADGLCFTAPPLAAQHTPYGITFRQLSFC